MKRKKLMIFFFGVLTVSVLAFVLALSLPETSEEWDCYYEESSGECHCDKDSNGGNGSCIQLNESNPVEENPLFYTAGFDATDATPAHCRAYAACAPIGYKLCTGSNTCMAREGYVKCGTSWNSC